MVPVSVPVSFAGSAGARLAARLDLPLGPPRAYAVLAHSFTGSKDSIAAVRICRALALVGIASLRFDFTGHGESEGDLSRTTFRSAAADILAAARFLEAEHRAPGLLVGHGFGGTAALDAAGDLESVQAVATLNAAADPAHLFGLLRAEGARFDASGEAEVTINGTKRRLSGEFLLDVDGARLIERVSELRRALLILHAPTDTQVGIEHARRIFDAAVHPKSFISLDGADHFVSRPEDADFAAHMIATWVTRYLPEEPAAEGPEEQDVVVEETGHGKFQQEVLIGRHRLAADEPTAAGGDDTGPSPYGLLLAALGSCTSMTLRMYADRKGWPLEGVRVRLAHRKIHAQDCADCTTRAGRVDEIDRLVEMAGPLDDEQRARLLEIADKCPVHRTLHSEIKVRTREEKTGS